MPVLGRKRGRSGLSTEEGGNHVKESAPKAPRLQGVDRGSISDRDAAKSHRGKSSKKVVIHRTKSTPVKLPDITADERVVLRRKKLKYGELADWVPEELARYTGLPLRRCRELHGQAAFQSFEGVGPSLAKDMTDLDVCTYAELRAAHPVRMFKGIERLADARRGRHVPMDPCVLDVFRCAKAQAIHGSKLPSSLAMWAEWADFRKGDKDHPLFHSIDNEGVKDPEALDDGEGGAGPRAGGGGAVEKKPKPSLVVKAALEKPRGRKKKDAALHVDE